MRSKLNPKFSVKKAHELQNALSKKLSFADSLPERIRYVAGVDVAYLGSLSVGAVAVLDYETLTLVEHQVALVPTRIPYVPTLLSFREIPPAVSAIKRLSVEPDVFMVDGQGFAHPYGLGFASHLGLILGKPVVGVAKSLLCGKIEETDAQQGVRLLKLNGKTIGAQVVTRMGTKPVFVSVGNLVSLERAVSLVLECVGRYRLPEPIRCAHRCAGDEKRRLLGCGV
ncbi:MAG: endonuclease V [Candidatus Bathyarchaeia archaeon]